MSACRPARAVLRRLFPSRFLLRAALRRSVQAPGSARPEAFRTRRIPSSRTALTVDGDPPPVPPRPILLLLRGRVPQWLYATWDLLVRPDGMSLRRLRSCFTREHGAPPVDWLDAMIDCPYFEVFIPHRRPIGDIEYDGVGVVYADTSRHPGAYVFSFLLRAVLRHLFRFSFPRIAVLRVPAQSSAASFRSGPSWLRTTGGISDSSEYELRHDPS